MWCRWSRSLGHAEEINERWRAVRRGDFPAPALAGNELKLTPEQADDLIPYRKGSLGFAFQQYRKTTVWSQDKKPRTREDWMRAWKYIAPVFGHKNPNTVTLNMVAAFRDALRDSVSVREAHRVIKIWSRSRSRFHLCENEPCNSSAPSWRALGTAPDRKHLLVLSFTGFDRLSLGILAPIARSALLPQGKNSIAGGCSPVPPSCARARGEPAAERALHEADQEHAGKSDEDCGERQIHVLVSAISALMQSR